MEASEKIKKYFENLEKEITSCYAVSTKARKEGYDPEPEVNIPVAKSIAQRVEGLISAVSPQILKSGVAQRIEKLEKEHGVLDWRVALKIAEEVAKQKFCKFKDTREAMEVGIRVGLAYITLGVIAAPLEGFIELKIKKTKTTGKEYLSCFFAGPIRAAGGTAEAVTIVIADYIREKMGYEKYDPDETEIKRGVTEVLDYHDRVTNLQYLPSKEEVDFLIRNIAVEVNGDPTEKIEVSNYKDLPRIETNRIRGGFCLVLAEGVAQKAPKIYKQLNEWGKDMGLDWGFLKEFLSLQKRMKAGESEAANDEKISPNYTYIKDLVAGRPVLAHPLAKGGFRLRYGRTRLSGFAADAISPLTLGVLDNYIATGTQLKIERPGKANVLTPCDYLEGPIIKLENGDVVKIDSEKDLKENQDKIKEILFLGDLLVNYGDFSENGHKLVPAGYCEEWWVQELEKKIVDLFGSLDLNKLSDMIKIKEEDLSVIINDPIKTKISSRAAFNISKELDIPLHPDYTFFWGNITNIQFLSFLRWIRKANIKKEDGRILKLVMPYEEEEKRTLEILGIPHLFVNNEFVVVEKEYADALFRTLNLEKEIPKEIEEYTTTLECVNSIADVVIRDKSGTYIGARMGRPEKAKMRKLTGSPHVLFPVGDEGGRLRSFQSALEKGNITADFPMFKCASCNRETIFSVCEVCGKKTKRVYYCNTCGTVEKKCDHDPKIFLNKSININEIMKDILKKLKTKRIPDLIKGVRGTSNKEHIPEHLIKGILRAKHNIFVNKDGTTRYDMTELPITHFKPSEIRASVQKLKELGYEKDIKGKSLENENQIVEIFPQDVILPSCPSSPDEPADDVLFRIANFVDDILINLYGLEPYYKLKTKDELIGHLIIGLAPHTSAGTVGRIIGFSKTQGFFTNPMFHAAMRRNCDGDEACCILLMDALLNFSRNYLPDRRGSRTMDAPLVLTSILDPSEVDDEVHGMDIAWRYPLELYEAALEYKKPWEVKIKQIDHFLGTKNQYEGFGYTHPVTNMNQGVLCSAYKTLPSMEEKLKGQMELAEKILAVDETDVARLVIEKHFLRDIKGNLRKFSMQQFRCTGCNEKYRRPPLIGRCLKCGGNIIFTISEGSIVKYLEPSISLANKYNVSVYLKQTLELTKQRIEDVFGKEKEKQVGLGSWF